MEKIQEICSVIFKGLNLRSYLGGKGKNCVFEALDTILREPLLFNDGLAKLANRPLSIVFKVLDSVLGHS